MPWKSTGVAIAAIVASLIVLGRVSGIVVDWAWFSTIGYVNVFWTVFAAKAVLFIAVFAVSGLLLWANGTLALRFASQRRLSLSAALDPNVMTGRTLPAVQTRYWDRLPWRSLITAGALVIALLVAMGETGQWDLILRFIYQVPYGQSDPLFDKDIGFYLFSLPVYVALKNWMLLTAILSARWPERCIRPWRNRSGPSALAHFARRHPTAPRCWVSISR